MRILNESIINFPPPHSFLYNKEKQHECLKFKNQRIKKEWILISKQKFLPRRNHSGAEKTLSASIYACVVQNINKRYDFTALRLSWVQLHTCLMMNLCREVWSQNNVETKRYWISGGKYFSVEGILLDWCSRSL